MVAAFDIVTSVYFPKELPPPFTTASFARNYGSLPASKVPDSLCLRYSYSKYASVRRTVAIPNPAHMIALANAVSTNWNALDQHCAKSTLSRTTPQPATDRAIV